MLSKKLLSFVKRAGIEALRPPGVTPQSLAAASQAIEPYERVSQLPRLQRAGRAGAIGALGGAGLGILREGLSSSDNKNYLRNTLAGALLGGLGAGGASYLSEASPFVRGGAPAKSFEVAHKRYMDTLLSRPEVSTSEAARGALQTGLYEYLSGKHEFKPDEQGALTQQFVKARVPTGGGWRRRVNLAQQAVTSLMAEPRTAPRQLALLEKVAPDPEMRTLAGEALARIRSGAASTPEGQHALATLARAMQEKLPSYRKATNILDALNVMKEMYGKGALGGEDVAKNVGLITGRFGEGSPETEQTRRLVQQTLARPIELHPRSPYGRASSTPDIGQLIERAMAQ